MNSFKALVLLFVFCLFSVLGFSAPAEKEKLLFVIKRNAEPIPSTEKAKIVLDLKEAVKRLPALAKSGFTITDWNFGKTVPSQLNDSDRNGVADQIVFDFTFTSNDPVYTFFIQPSKEKPSLISSEININPHLEITYLTSSGKSKSVNSWPDKIIESTMRFYLDATALTINSPGKWNYEVGIFLSAMYNQSHKTNNAAYLRYIKTWADRFINSEGKIDSVFYPVKEYKLDDIIPGRPALFLYEATKEEKYKTVADQLADQLLHQPKTSDGGYWHKKIYSNQMWLDGIYMGDVFSTHYAALFNKPEFFDEAIHQIKLIDQHTTDVKTGLMYHGWDESKNKVWADQATGTSPEFWGRAIGWYMTALVECLDYIPENHPERKEVVAILQKLSKSVLKYQDAKSNLWYQVVDKGNREGNWIETSGSAMFAYAFAKGCRKGYLDKSYQAAARKAFDSLINSYVYFDDAGKLYLDQTVKVGTLNMKTSKGDYAYYISTERRINDYKGLGALLYVSMELK